MLKEDGICSSCVTKIDLNQPYYETRLAVLHPFCWHNKVGFFRQIFGYDPRELFEWSYIYPEITK